MVGVTKDELSDLVANLTIPAGWSCGSCVTFQVLKDVVNIIEDTGQVKSTLNEVLSILVPEVDKSLIPKYANIRRKVFSKSVDLSAPVPWLSPVPIEQPVGPLSQELGINTSVLAGIAPFPNCTVTNGLILELRNYHRKKKFTWDKFGTWLKAMKITDHDLPIGSVRSSVQRLQAKYTAAKGKRQQGHLEVFMSQPYSPPEVIDLQKQNRRLLDTCSDLRHQVKELQKCNSQISRQLFSQTQARDLIEQALSVSEQQRTKLQAETATITSELHTERDTVHQLSAKAERQSHEIDKCKKQLATWSLPNAKRRQVRRDLKIDSQQQQLNQLKLECQHKDSVIEHMEASNELLENQKRALLSRKNYAKRQCQTRDDVIKKQRVQLDEAELTLRESQQKVLLLADENASLQAEQSVREARNSEGLYSDAMRQTVMGLCSQGVGTRHVGQVVQTVSQTLFGTTFNAVPSATTAKRMIEESNVVGKIQAARTVLSEPAVTLHCDGTSDHQRHFFGWQVTTQKESLCLALGETVSSDATTQMNELRQIVSDLASVLSTDVVEQQKTEEELMLSFKNLMTDQSSVNKAFREQLESVRENILGGLDSGWGNLSVEERHKKSSVNQWFCLLHVLLGFADGTENALLDYQDILTDGGKVSLGREKDGRTCRRDGSAALEAVKATCSLLTSSGHPAAGVPADFAAWMAVRGKKIHLRRFCHTRFNIIFLNSAAVYHHRVDILLFLEESSADNQLIQAVRGDLSDDVLCQCIRGIAMFGCFITMPYHRLVLRRDIAPHILDVNPYLVQMRETLETLSSTPYGILANKEFIMWADLPPVNDEVHRSVMPQDMSVEGLDLTMEVLSLIATHCLVVLSRQLAHQLPGGEFGEDSPQVRHTSSSVPKSNSIGESQFAMLKHLRTIKPNASVPNLEATVMWAYNKTLLWVSKLSSEDRGKVFESARLKTPSFRAMWAKRAAALREARLNKIRSRQDEKVKRQVRAVHTRQKNTVDVEEKGGYCHSVEEVSEAVERMQTPKQRLEWLKSQLRFYKTVIAPPGVPRSLYNFSKLGKPFSVAELTTNLKSVISKVSTLDSTTSTSCTIPVAEERAPKLQDVRKKVLCNYHTHSASGPCRKGKAAVGEFPNSPVGMSFRHRWLVNKRHKWFQGTVIKECPDGDSAASEDDVNPATASLYRTFKVAYNGEEELLTLHLEKDFCRGDLEFLPATDW